jgi:hypothetical protein
MKTLRRSRDLCKKYQKWIVSKMSVLTLGQEGPQTFGSTRCQPDSWGVISLQEAPLTHHQFLSVFLGSVAPPWLALSRKLEVADFWV